MKLASLIVLTLCIVDFNGQTVHSWSGVTNYKQPHGSHLIVWTGPGQPDHYQIPPGCAVVVRLP